MCNDERRMTDEELFRKYCPDFCAGGECLEPYFSVFQAGMDVIREGDALPGRPIEEMRGQIRSGTMTREELKTATTEKLIGGLEYCGRDSYYATYYDEIVDEITRRLKQNEKLQEKITQLEELLAEQYPDLRQSLEWAAQRENELVEENLNLKAEYGVLSCSVGDFGELQDRLDEEQRKNNGLQEQLEKMKEQLRRAKDSFDRSTDKTPVRACGAEYRLFCDIERMLEDWGAEE